MLFTKPHHRRAAFFMVLLVRLGFIYFTTFFWSLVAKYHDQRYVISAFLAHSVWVLTWVFLSMPLLKCWSSLKARRLSAIEQMMKVSTGVPGKSEQINLDGLEKLESIAGIRISLAGAGAVASLAIPVIDVLDGVTGLLQYRVALPIQAANVYDALAIDDNDGLLFVLTANGIAEINLSSLPPSPAESKHLRAVMSRGKPNRGVAKGFAMSNTNQRQNQSARTDWLERPRLSRGGSFGVPNSGKRSQNNAGRAK